MDQVMDVISVITALLNALAWPLVALFVIIRFTPPLIKLIGGGKDVTIKVLNPINQPKRARVERTGGHGPSCMSAHR